MRSASISLLIVFFAGVFPMMCSADEGVSDQAATSQDDTQPPPKHSFARRALLWLPNRVLDFLDIFHIDVGVGPAAGAVVRVTKYGQVGFRQMLPVSARVGLMGRRLPVMLEHSNEIGAGPLFMQSGERNVCPGEVGAGADLFIAGAYVGICLDEVVDFVGGIFFLDLKDDDLH